MLLRMFLLNRNLSSVRPSQTNKSFSHSPLPYLGIQVWESILVWRSAPWSIQEPYSMGLIHSLLGGISGPGWDNADTLGRQKWLSSKIEVPEMLVIYCYQHLNTIQSKSETGPDVWMSTLSLLTCHACCKCSMETSRNWVKSQIRK